MTEEFTCPRCDQPVPVEVETWTELFGWVGECPNCGEGLEMENDCDADDSFSFWLIRREMVPGEVEIRFKFKGKIEPK